MSSNPHPGDLQVRLPRTAVPSGLEDPVTQARAELKAALFAIEDKVNVPRRVAHGTDRAVKRARLFAQRNPTGAAVAVVAVAAVVGTAVWAAVRAYTR